MRSDDFLFENIHRTEERRAMMFETTRFYMNTGAMNGAVKSATRAKEKGDDRRALMLLKKALLFGRTALGIHGRRISVEQKVVIRDCISDIQTLYQKELIARMSDDDQELLSWAKTVQAGTIVVDILKMKELAVFFDVARTRLDDTKKTLGVIYDGKHAPASLRAIMCPFIAGEATREETERRLYDCATKLWEWIPEFFPGEPVSTAKHESHR